MKPLAEHKTRLILEEGCLDKKGELLLSLGERALILTGKNGAVRSGALADAIAALSANDQTFRIFDKISENPTTEVCREAAKEALNARADFILAIGGGSVMDAGKLVALLAATGEESGIDGFTDDLLYSADLSEAACLPIAVVGTTAGTGSEVTNIAVLTRNDGTKKGISAPCLYPAIAFADTRYTESMSPLTTWRGFPWRWGIFCICRRAKHMPNGANFAKKCIRPVCWAAMPLIFAAPPFPIWQVMR